MRRQSLTSFLLSPSLYFSLSPSSSLSFCFRVWGCRDLGDRSEYDLFSFA